MLIGHIICYLDLPKSTKNEASIILKTPTNKSPNVYKFNLYCYFLSSIPMIFFFFFIVNVVTMRTIVQIIISKINKAIYIFEMIFKVFNGGLVIAGSIKMRKVGI